MSVDITATTFAKFCAARGGARVTIVKNAKNKYLTVGYKQGPDYWKPLRDELPRALRSGQPAAALQTFLASGHVLPDRYERYSEAVAGLTKWIGKKKITVQHPPQQVWSSGQLNVKVNPELALSIDGRPFVVKLWFNSTQPLTKPRADPLLHLLDMTHGAGAGSKATVAVLDVLSGKMFKPTRLVPGIDALLKGEAACFVEMWEAL